MSSTQILRAYKGYELHQPESGGKAGYGKNVTSAIQVRKDNCIVKRFRYRISDKGNFKLALRCAPTIY